MTTSLEQRIDRLESIQSIQQLAARYAMAVDARDVDAYLDCYVNDVDCGRRGRGREAFRPFVEAAIRNFYRSIHSVGTHVIDTLDGDHATGRQYGRCEHECGERWIVQANVYFDTYERRDGRWYFVRRDEDFHFSCDVMERPQEAGFERWPGLVPRHRFSMMLDRYPSWSRFWSAVPQGEIDAVTRFPERAPQAAT